MRRRRAKAAAKKKCDIGSFLLISIDRRSQATASSSLPRENLAMPCYRAPDIGKRVMGAEAKSLLDMSLGFLRLAQENFRGPYLRMRVGQISIENQGPLELPDALRGAAGMDLDQAQEQMDGRILRSNGQHYDSAPIRLRQAVQLDRQQVNLSRLLYPHRQRRAAQTRWRDRAPRRGRRNASRRT